jgi:hypothetical protein
LVDRDERKRLFKYLEERFGIPQRLFEDYWLLQHRKTWALWKKNRCLAGVARLKTKAVGMRAFRRVGAFIKPSTRLIQVFGDAATRAKVKLSAEELLKLAAEGELKAELALKPGYVILTLPGNRILGLGLYVEGRIISQLPRNQLRKEMIAV